MQTGEAFRKTLWQMSFLIFPQWVFYLKHIRLPFICQIWSTISFSCLKHFLLNYIRFCCTVLETAYCHHLVNAISWTPSQSDHIMRLPLYFNKKKIPSLKNHSIFLFETVPIEIH
jgi:hypothetical protein